MRNIILFISLETSACDFLAYVRMMRAVGFRLVDVEVFENQVVGITFQRGDENGTPPER